MTFWMQVGHLALVEDDTAAWVISWHISSDMNCYITKTTAAAKRIHHESGGRQEVMPLDGVYVNPDKRSEIKGWGESFESSAVGSRMVLVIGDFLSDVLSFVVPQLTPTHQTWPQSLCPHWEPCVCAWPSDLPPRPGELWTRWEALYGVLRHFLAFIPCTCLRSLTHSSGLLCCLGFLFLQINWFTVVSVFPSCFADTAARVNGSTWAPILPMRNRLSLEGPLPGIAWPFFSTVFKLLLMSFFFPSSFLQN